MAIGIGPMALAPTCEASKLKSTSCTGFGPHVGLAADPSFAPLVMLKLPASMPLLVPEPPICAPLLMPELLPLPATPLVRPPQAASAKSANAPGDHRRRLSEGGSSTRESFHQRGGEARAYINKSGEPLDPAAFDVIGTSGEKLGVMTPAEAALRRQKRRCAVIAKEFTSPPVSRTCRALRRIGWQ
jgi:hypothetical protein